MPPKANKKTAEKENSKGECFVWSDDEVELLLKVTMEFKTSNLVANVDWESCASKYRDILKLLVDQYPNPENAKALGKDFPHKQGHITQSILTSKLKNIRRKYRQAVDSGRKSGHGRVVLLYFDLCEEIWGGSPATTTIDEGIETTGIIEEVNSASSSESPGIASVESSGTAGVESGSDDETASCSTSTDNASRDLLNSRLKGYKVEKLKRKLPVDTQLFNISQEELQIKKKLVEKMDNMDRTYTTHMEKLTTNMERLTGSISDGFALLRQILCPTTDMAQSHYQPHPANFNNNNMFLNTGHHGHTSNGPASNSGHFSFTQSLYSNDEDLY